ncbi:cytochrome P450 [Rhizophagus clarus]|uniref:Cytochrome P450 n=1 Tax=Rhizophagus clarus TaxID=94130 RepID=A0A8H3QDF9_9GLOM|nr:cytochrome P450 [Rhizophagus clarus]
MLTSVIIANTPHDVNYAKTVCDESLSRALSNSEIHEIDRAFQHDKTVDDFQKLIYCEAIAKEVSCIFVVRTIKKPDEIAEYKWPAVDVIHHNKDIGKKLIDKFNPDRWLFEGFESKKLSLL